jgi:hypothetical protein
MITLLASIAGFFTAIIPDILKIFTDHNDKKHELAMMDHQIRMQEHSIDRRLEKVKSDSEAIQVKALYHTFKRGIIWADALNASVRPVLAYFFFGLYALIKYFQFTMIVGLADHNLLLKNLWTIDDQAIFAGIISFYFGQRTMAKRARDR